MTTDSITFARAIRPEVTLAKTIVLRDDAITGIQPAPKAFLFAFREVAVTSLAELTAAVADAATRGEIAVRAAPRSPTGRRAIHDDDEKGPAGLAAVPRRWCAFDWDGLPLEHQSEPQPVDFAFDETEFANWSEPDPLLDPEIGARIALRRLPPAFRDVTCGWQVSASAGFKSGFRLRTWHWLDHPVTGTEVKTWLAPAIKRGLVDPVTLVEAQPHYLAVTVHSGADPCPKRFGMLHLERSEVHVPDIAGIKRRQDQRARASRPPEQRQAPRNPDEANTYAQRRIDECLAVIRSATARHTTYKGEAARARAICDKYGLDWASVRRDLITAYESTLSPAEVKERRSFSTEGILDWLEARAAA